MFVWCSQDVSANPDGSRSEPNNRRPNRRDFEHLASLYSQSPHEDSAPTLSRKLMTTIVAHHRDQTQHNPFDSHSAAAAQSHSTVDTVPKVLAVQRGASTGFSRRLMLAKSEGHAPTIIHAHHSHTQPATSFAYPMSGMVFKSSCARKLLISTKHEETETDQDFSTDTYPSMVQHQQQQHTDIHVLHQAESLEEVTSDPTTWGDMVTRGPRRLVFRKRVGINRFVQTELMLADDHGAISNGSLD